MPDVIEGPYYYDESMCECGHVPNHHIIKSARVNNSPSNRAFFTQLMKCESQKHKCDCTKFRPRKTWKKTGVVNPKAKVFRRHV